MMPWLFLLGAFSLAAFFSGRYWDSHLAPLVFGKTARKPPSGEFFIGLSRLIDEEGDDSIDTFIRLLEDHAEDLESRLALSTLLRRRGKVDQSVALCQKILSSSSLSVEQVAEVKMELARSFIAAGLLDRVEKILSELTTRESLVREQALELSITLYQIEKEWHNAIETAQELVKLVSGRQRDNINLMLSHFYCEMARESSHNEAGKYLALARSANADNPRITELQLMLDASEGNDDAVVTGLQKCMVLFPERLTDIFESLSLAYPEEAVRTGTKMISAFDAAVQSSPSVVLFYAELLQKFRGVNAAADFLKAQLVTQESPVLVWKLLSLPGEISTGSQERDRIQQLAAQYMSGDQDIPHYFCLACGFEAKLHHWQCPGCSQWSTFRPVSEKSVIQQVKL